MFIYQTMRDTAEIRPPGRQLFALSIFEFYDQRPNRPLKWPFGHFLKNWKSVLILKVYLWKTKTVKTKVCHKDSTNNFYYWHFSGKCTGKIFQILKKSVRSSCSSNLWISLPRAQYCKSQNNEWKKACIWLWSGQWLKTKHILTGCHILRWYALISSVQK